MDDPEPGMAVTGIRLYVLWFLILVLASSLEAWAAEETNADSNANNQETAAAFKGYQQYLDAYRNYQKTYRQQQAVNLGFWAVLLLVVSLVLWVVIRLNKRLAERAIRIHEANYELLVEIRDILKQRRG